MGGSALARNCRKGFASALCQVFCAVLFVGVCIYASAVALQPFQLAGVSSIPPGLLHARDDRI